MQLYNYSNLPTKKLSGGNKRKLCIALSLVGAPNILFLDEPFAGMDPNTRKYIYLNNQLIMVITKRNNYQKGKCYNFNYTFYV